MLDSEAWDKLMAVNSRGVFLGTKHAVLAMKQTGGGSIVNLSSIAGVTGSARTHMGYNASKGAVRTLTNQPQSNLAVTVSAPIRCILV